MACECYRGIRDVSVKSKEMHLFGSFVFFDFAHISIKQLAIVWLSFNLGPPTSGRDIW